MAQQLDASFYLVWASLLGAPPIAIGIFAVVHWRWPSALAPVAIGSATAIVVVIGFALLSTTFTSTLVNVACISLAYLAYCFLAASCWKIRLLAVRVLALIVAAVPIGAGYALGTVGALGLAFIVGDYARPPKQTMQMTDDLMCRVTGWGMAASDSGYTVHLYKRWPGLSFVEREVVSIIINETSPSEPETASCSDVLATYAKNHSL